MQPRTTDEILRETPITEAAQTSEQKDAIIASKSRFIDNMAYQIRTLSNAIIGFSDLLRQEELNDAQREYVTEIYSAGQGLASLVNDVLDLSKLENGQLQLEVADCSVAWLLDEVQSLIEPSATENGLEFRIEKLADLPENIRTDPTRLRQCLINLTGNAVKYTRRGHVHVRVAPETCQGREWLRFDVVDSGTGIPKEKLATIFQPYAGRDEANQSILASLSHGLAVNSGLAVANQLVRLLGGRIAVVSEQGSGSIFTLLVPIQPAPVRHVSPRSAARQPDPADELCGDEIGQCRGNVLLVEDEPSNQTVLMLLMEAMGLQVSAASDGVEGVEMAVSGRYDLILMDIKMPRMDGHEAARTLREKGVSTPIIGLSAAGTSVNEDFNGFIAKPVDSRGLLKAIGRFLPSANGQGAAQCVAATGSQGS